MQFLQHFLLFTSSVTAIAINSVKTHHQNPDIIPRDAFITEAELELRLLEKRDLPPCGKRWDVPGGQDAPQWAIDDANKSLQPHNGIKPYKAGWRHPICDYKYENCIRLGKNVTMQNNGFAVRGHWWGQDDTQLVSFHYWQQQVLFNGPKASGKVYLAHGSTWTCTKGDMTAYLADDNYYLWGYSKNDHDATWGGPCKCFYKLNTDMSFYVNEHPAYP